MFVITKYQPAQHQTRTSRNISTGLPPSLWSFVLVLPSSNGLKIGSGPLHYKVIWRTSDPLALGKDSPIFSPLNKGSGVQCKFELEE